MTLPLTPKVGPSGPSNARILLVGEAPGRDEERLAQPFVGVSGNLLRECLFGVGINPEDVFFTNLCRFRPPNNELRAWYSNLGEPNEIVQAGLADLEQEIAAVNPNLIIPLGNYPLHHLTGRAKWSKEGYTGIGDYRGYQLPGTALCGGRKCLPTYHPAAAVRQYPLKHILRTDLAKARAHSASPILQYSRKFILVDPSGPYREAWTSWLTSPAGTPSPPFQWNTPRGQVHPEGIQTVDSGSFLSSDIEYIGSQLLCVGFTRHPDVAVVFSTPNSHEINHVRAILLSGIPLCFQNGMFDCSILEWFFDTPALRQLKHDTMYMMHSAYIEFPKDLGFIGSLYTNNPPWWQHINKDFWNEIREKHRSIDEVLNPYNAYDVMTTQEAAEKLLADELQDPNVAKTYQHEISLVNPLWQISKEGVLIDVPRLTKLQTDLQEEIDAMNYGLTVLNGGTEVNVMGGQQVAKFLYEVMGISNVGAPKTPTGKWKMDDDWLATLQLRVKDERQRTALRMVRETRERRSLISKFCEIELDDDGRMRCHYDPAKTDTGRLASRKFYPTGRGANLQNVPRDTRVRAVFIPPRGHLFGYADLKSAESLVVAHITGDLEMLRLHSPEYMSGGLDGHKYVASFLFNKPIERITKEERYLGKRVRHAGNYGMSWAKLMSVINAEAQETGVSIDAAQAKVLIAKYRQLHPMLQTWWNDVLAQLNSTHTLYSCHGRKRVFYDRPESILPEAIAYNPQSTVADTLNMGLLNVVSNEFLKEVGFKIILQVHDAIGFQVPESSADEAIRLLPELMDVPVPISRRGVPSYLVRIPTDIQVGYNWGESDEDPKRPGSALTKDGKPASNPNGLKPWKP